MAYTFMGGRVMSIACHNYAATKIHTCVGTAHSREGGGLVSTILIHSAYKTTAWINIDLDLETTSNHIMPDNIRRASKGKCVRRLAGMHRATVEHIGSDW